MFESYQNMPREVFYDALCALEKIGLKETTVYPSSSEENIAKAKRHGERIEAIKLAQAALRAQLVEFLS